MANEIRLKRGSGSDPSASDLVTGEIAIRTDTGKLFTKKDDGSVAEISGGGIDDGDKGDITVSNSGGTFTIDNDAVTYAKIQNVSATNRILGRDSSGAGNIEEITPANVRTMLGLASSATTDTTNASNISSGTISDDRLPATISSDITGSAATLTNARSIAGTSFNGSASIDIDYNNLTNLPTIPSNTNQLTNGAGFLTSVGTSNISNNAVDFTKIQDISHSTIIGRAVGSSGGNPAALTAAQVRAIINVENGATADQTASEILTLIKTVDGSGSGLDADLLDGANASVSAGNNTIVKRHSSGYIFANFFNTTPNTVTSGVTQICVETGNDGYIRHGTAAAVRTFLNVENGATADQSASEILTLIKTVDGAGSGLDADTLDGVSSASFLRSDASDSATQPLTFSGGGGAATIGGNSDIRFSNGNWTGNAVKIQHHSNYLYISGGSNGIIFREDGTDRARIDGDGHFRPAVDSTYDIGTSSIRWRNGYFDNVYGSGANLTSIPYSALTGTPTIPTNNNQLTNGAGYITSATNNFVSSASFNTGNGVLTLNRSGLGAVTVDLDGRFATGTIPTNNNQLSNGRGFITGSGNTTGQARFLENSRTGSPPNYALRGWVNFKGTGSVSVRSSGNVSSITDFGQGNYRVNFSTAMPDSNYATTTIGAYDKTNSLAPFIVFSQGGFGSNPIQYNTSGVRCGSTFGDFHIATLMFAR